VLVMGSLEAPSLPKRQPARRTRSMGGILGKSMLNYQLEPGLELSHLSPSYERAYSTLSKQAALPVVESTFPGD